MNHKEAGSFKEASALGYKDLQFNMTTLRFLKKTWEETEICILYLFIAPR